MIASDALLAGNNTARLEAAIPEGLSAAIDERARQLSGGKPGNYRSKAIRDLLVRGILSLPDKSA